MKRDQGSLNKKKIFFSKWNCGDPFVERRESGTDARFYFICQLLLGLFGYIVYIDHTGVSRLYAWGDARNVSYHWYGCSEGHAKYSSASHKNIASSRGHEEMSRLIWHGQRM